LQDPSIEGGGAAARAGGSVAQVTVQEPIVDGRTHAYSACLGFIPASVVARSLCEEISELILELAVFDFCRLAASRFTVLGQLPGFDPGVSFGSFSP
jgi:hypothetical protein